MPERTSYTQGTPSWVDLPTTDPEAAKAFYAGVFGWSYDDQPMGEGAVYSIAKVRGLDVAAISPQPQEMAAAGAPPMWGTYITVDSADDAAAKVGAAGGKVLMEPMDVMSAGRMVLAMDPSGAMVAFWQANEHIGARLVNEPGALVWNELITSDPSSVKFYEQVAGMTTSAQDMGQGQPYTVFQAGDAMVGGTTPPMMEGVPNHWHVYFGVDDADATAAKVTELGGTILVPPFDTPVGRIAVAQDPQGAVFSFMKNAPQPG
jgi:predicted enzyme related to lactoylglutathione lyase